MILQLPRTNFKPLDEMERVGKQDLYEFIQTHNIRLPRDRRDAILQDILERTNGDYILTIGELRRLVNRALDSPEPKPSMEAELDDEFDY